MSEKKPHLQKDEDGYEWLMVPPDEYEARSKAQIQTYREKLERELAKDQHAFSFADMENIKYIAASVPDKFCGYLMYLQSYLDFSGIISHYTGIKVRAYVPMRGRDIMQVLGVKKTVYSDFMRCMKQHGIIHEESVNGSEVYTIDPRYHWKGTTDNERVIKIFSAAMRELYRDVGASDLGFVYKLLPFVHFETNFICANPYERDPQRITKLSRDEISRITGMSVPSVYAKLRKLKLGEHYVFAQVSHGETAFYMINPFIFYRKHGYPDRTLQSIFAVKPVRPYRRR